MVAVARAGGRRPPVPDPDVCAPSGEPWASVRTLYEAGGLQKVSVARLAGMSAAALRERAKKEAWIGAPRGGGVSRSIAGVAPPPASPSAALPGSPSGDPTPGTSPGQALPQGEGGCPSPVAENETAKSAPAASDALLPPDPRTASGRAALVDQLYGLFAAQLAAAGGEDGLGGGLEQRMRSLATFAKTLDALVDLDKRLGARPETEGSDFDAYRAELERCLAGLVGGGS